MELKDLIGKEIKDFGIVDGNFSIIIDNFFIKFKDKPLEIGRIREENMDLGESPFDWKKSINKKFKGTIYKVYNKYVVWILRLWFFITWIVIVYGIILMTKHWDVVVKWFGSG